MLTYTSQMLQMLRTINLHGEPPLPRAPAPSCALFSPSSSSGSATRRRVVPTDRQFIHYLSINSPPPPPPPPPPPLPPLPPPPPPPPLLLLLFLLLLLLLLLLFVVVVVVVVVVKVVVCVETIHQREIEWRDIALFSLSSWLMKKFDCALASKKKTNEKGENRESFLSFSFRNNLSERAPRHRSS